ncbi:MAG TPA: hypothetical protein DCY94_05275, partial [Firmicutes bacterium]|nr:hypothetical protein [Bacillota bacterium]
GLVNTYLEKSLSYTLEYKTTKDGTYQLLDTAHTNVPQSDRADDYNLAKNITIPAGSTYYYKLNITFNNLADINQEADRTAILSTKFNLGEAIVESPSLYTLKKLKLTVKDGNPDFATTATTDETEDGLYSLQDDYGTSYYYRGAVENNYVKFGGFFWRIIRINGDGSLRMIYDGTQAWPNANGATAIWESDRHIHIKPWNANYNDAKYVGWMFGGDDGTASTKQNIDGTETSETEKGKAATYNQTDSDLKELWVDPWYKTNIEDKSLSKYIGDEIFCNDRSTAPSGSTWWTSENTTYKGFGVNTTAYGGAYRVFDSGGNVKTPEPTFVCPEKNDAFTVSDTTKGNGSLMYPIGLITVDEIVTAGSGSYGKNNQYYYLYKKSRYFFWSFSPNNYIGNSANLFKINVSGGLHNANANDGSSAVAPVINIAPQYAKTMVGEGSMTSPYQIPGVD